LLVCDSAVDIRCAPSYRAVPDYGLFLALVSKMRRTFPALVAFLAFGLAGCFLFQPGGKSMWPSRSWLGNGISGPDVVYIDLAVLEVPIGDRYANEEIWTSADEQILSPAQRASLEQNGLRVGLINGRTPDHLLELLTSKRSNPNAIQHRGRAGNPTTVALASEIPSCEFVLQAAGDPRPIKLEQATGQFQVMPALDAEGKVRLTFTPQFEYHDHSKWARLNPAVAISLQGQRSTESYPALSWDMAIAANEYVVVGARFEKPKSLGFQFFVTPSQDHPIQRLLAIRAGRLSNGANDSTATVSSPRVASAASQAAGQ
jgi:hypothetical protein